MNSLSSFPPLFYNLSFVTSVGTNHPPFQKSLAQTLQQHHSLLNTKHSTLTSLTSWCLQYISHILPHSGVHLFHSLFLLLIRNTYTSPPDCPEHPYNIHYPFPITSISSTQQTQPSHKQPHTKQHLSLPCWWTFQTLFLSRTLPNTKHSLSHKFHNTIHPVEMDVPLFRSLFILLIQTTFTVHSYCS